MKKPLHILVLDCGTTNIKAFVFDQDKKIIAKAEQPLIKIKPQRGWVEQSPLEMVHAAKIVLRAALKKSGLAAGQIKSLGITNQRETIIAWNKITGRPIYNAIVWEDTRTARACASLKKHADFVAARTGLTINPYFSATKIKWLLQNVPAAARLLAADNLLVGTVDSWLLFNLSVGAPHLTDETNAARTLLFDIKTRQWSRELADLFAVPLKILPRVQSSRSSFGKLKSEICGAPIPVRAMCGDQQASMFAALHLAQTAQKKSSAQFGVVTKITFGTGIFILQDLGHKFVLQKTFFTTLLPSVSGGLISGLIGTKSHYALETKIGDCAVRVQQVLKNQKKLTALLSGFARQTDKILRQLPVRPKKIIIDGGVTRDGIMRAQQEKISRRPVVPQEPYDGTALGAALLAAK